MVSEYKNKLKFKETTNNPSDTEETEKSLLIGKDQDTEIIGEQIKVNPQTLDYGWGVRHIQVGCMFMATFNLFIVRSSMSVAVLAMTDVKRRNETTIFDWDKWTQSVILSSFFWGYLVAQIPAGLLAKRFGGKIINLVALFGNGVCCLMLPTLARWGGWPLVCVMRVVIGMLQACLLPGSHTLTGRWFPVKEQTSFSGFVFGGCQWGSIVGLPLSGILAESFGWEMIFYSNAGLLLISSVIWWFFAASSASEHRMMSPEELAYIKKEMTCTGSHKTLKAPFKAIMTSKAVYAIIISHFGSGFYHTLLFVDLLTYYKKALHISLQNSASLASISFFGMWIGNIVSSNLCDKLINGGCLSLPTARKLFNSVSFFGTALGLILITLIPKEMIAIFNVLVFITLAVGGAQGAAFMVNHLDISPNYAGVLLSISNSACCFGNLIIPLITSTILHNDPTDVSRWKLVFITAAIVTGLSNVMFLLFSSTERQPWDDPDFMKKKGKVSDLEELKPVL